MLSNSFRCTCNSRKVFEPSPSRSLWSTCTQSYVDTNNVFLYLFFPLCSYMRAPIQSYFEIIYRVRPIFARIFLLSFFVYFHFSIGKLTKMISFQGTIILENWKKNWVTQLLHSDELLSRTVLLIIAVP